MKLKFPDGRHNFVDDQNGTWTPDSNRNVEIGAADPAQFLAAGFTQIDTFPHPTYPQGGPFPLPSYPAFMVRPSTARPAPVSPGTTIFDSTIGKPLWRNALNTEWVDAAGSVVATPAPSAANPNPANLTAYTTAQRPTTTTAGMEVFDSTLGIVIKRNAENTAWTNSAGNTV